MPIGFNLETIIAPVAELILMKSVPKSRRCPSEKSTPLYFHVAA
jgi:hypothetical protein